MRVKFFVIALILFSFLIVCVSVQAQYLKRDVSKLQVGMTTDEVKSLFGRPNHINKYGGPRGEEQQWVYKESRSQDLYLYFEDGRYNGYYQRTGEKPSRLP